MALDVQFLKKLSRWTDKLVQVVSMVLLVVMLSLSLAAILSQVILDAPITWGYSLTRLFLPWIALLSITVTLKAGEHIGITFFLKLVPTSVAGLARHINLAVVGAFGLALIWYGSVFFINSTQTFMVSDTLQLSHRWTAAALPITGVIILIHVMGGISLSQEETAIQELNIDQGGLRG